MRLIASIAFAIAPFAFSLVRALNSSRDLRMLWMTFAALLGTGAVMLLGKAPSQPRRVVKMLSPVAFVAGTLLAALTAMRLGATAAAGIWPVAIVLSACWTASLALYSLSDDRTT